MTSEVFSEVFSVTVNTSYGDRVLSCLSNCIKRTTYEEEINSNYKAKNVKFRYKTPKNYKDLYGFSNQELQTSPFPIYDYELKTTIIRTDKKLTYVSDDTQGCLLFFSCIRKNLSNTTEYVVARASRGTTDKDGNCIGNLCWLTKRGIKSKKKPKGLTFSRTNKIYYGSNGTFKLSLNGNKTHEFTTKTFSVQEEKIGPDTGYENYYVALCFIIGRFNNA